ncbi:MAG: division/cell wall cluster transcriptional repressor MraZ [Chloroflexota bacterium]
MVGTFEYRVDEKGRVPLPPRWRHEFRGEFYLTVAAEKCVTGYSADEWKRVTADLGSDPIPNETTRRVKRRMLADAYAAELDAQGRVILSPILREHAGIVDSAIVIGQDNYFEVWNPESWRAEHAVSTEQAPENIEKLRAQRRQ